MTRRARQNVGRNQPAMGRNQPPMGRNQPAMGRNQPAMGRNQPAMGRNQPPMGRNQPAMGRNQPPIGWNLPKTMKRLGCRNRWGVFERFWTFLSAIIEDMRILHQKLKLQGNNPNPADREKQSPLFLERGGLCSSLDDSIYDLVKPAMRFLMGVIMMSSCLFDLFDLFKLQENLSALWF